MKYQYYTGLQLYFVLNSVHFSEKTPNQDNEGRKIDLRNEWRGIQ